MDEIKELCLNLNEIRKGKSVSLDVLSEMADIDKSTLSKYERGVLCPKFDTLKKWASVLGHDVRLTLSESENVVA